jgi:hypothetical protein
MRIVVIGGAVSSDRNLLRNLVRPATKRERLHPIPASTRSRMTDWRGAEGRFGGSRCVELPFLGRHGSAEVTQFFEFLTGLADMSFDGDKVRLPPVLFPADGCRRCRERIARIT